jgi:hypothetical protein
VRFQPLEETEMTISRTALVWEMIWISVPLVYGFFLVLGLLLHNEEWDCECSFTIPEWRLRFTFYWKWFDLWIGVYILRRGSFANQRPAFYLQPLPCVGVKITLLPKESG